MVLTNLPKLKINQNLKYIIDNLSIQNECGIIINMVDATLFEYLNTFKIPSCYYQCNVEYVYPNSIDILDKLINCIDEGVLKDKYNSVFIQLLNPKENIKPHTCYIKKDDENAVLPTKTRCSDSGYDITIIKEKSRSGESVLYDTGIKIIPPPGYNIVIRPRSSFYKTGYMIANTIGTIDTSYRNTLFVPLIKIDKSKPDIELPFKGFQIILERFNHFELVQDEKKFIYETHRNLGGFGSTDNN